MTAAGDWQRVEELFHRVADLPPEQAGRLLDQECVDDADLRSQVESLLQADAGAEEVVVAGLRAAFDSAFPDSFSASGGAKPRQAVPERVGPYRVDHEIGRGGLSTVFLAHRDDEHFRKQVALKVVRRGLDTEDVLQRFRYERQILARFEHANIARLLDGGSLPDGRPFFVLEHVAGEPIDQYCAAHKLPLDDRLKLFRQVCSAVGYAHRNLVVHRDLKPNNILVTADGEPKLLDFGIAKVLDHDEARATQLHTTEGLLLLTPEYASPEQVMGQPLTTQTDVYSLGVLLYRLLTGSPPYQLKQRRLAEMTRVVCGQEPLPPSDMVQGEALAAAGLPADPARARRDLRGDLDTVVLKALSKETAHRYPSVDELSEDLRRYLHGERVSARPEGRISRARRWARRHRGLVSTLAGALMTLVMVVIFYTVQLRHERDEARRQAVKAERVSSLLVGMLKISDPDWTQGETVTVRELLDRAAARLDDDLADQPEIRASLMQLIGTIYGNLGLYEQAEPLLEKALTVRRVLDPEGAATAEAVVRLGELSYSMGHYDEAERLLTEALAHQERLFGPEAMEVGRTLNNLAAVHQALARFDRAEALYRQGHGIQLAAAGPDDREALVSRTNLAALLYQTGRLEAAEAMCRSTAENQRRVLGDNHSDLAATENTLAAVLAAQKRFDEASELLQRVLEGQKKLYGPEHPKVAGNLISLGALLYYLRRFDEAEDKYSEALEVQSKLWSEGHLQMVATLKNMADLQLHGRKNSQAAVDYLQRAWDLESRLLGTDHVDSAGTLLRLAGLKQQLGQAPEARRLIEQVSAIHQRLGDRVPESQAEQLARLLDLLAIPGDQHSPAVAH